MFNTFQEEGVIFVNIFLFVCNDVTAISQMVLCVSLGVKYTNKYIHMFVNNMGLVNYPADFWD